MTDSLLARVAADQAEANVEPAPPSEAELRREDLATEWLDLKAEAEKIAAKIADVEALIVAEGLDRFALRGMPNVGWRLQGPNRQFNDALARLELTEDEYNALCVSKPDPKLVRSRYGDRFHAAPANGKTTVKALGS